MSLPKLDGGWAALPLGFELERISHIDEELKERSLVKLNPVPDEMKQVEHIYQNTWSWAPSTRLESILYKTTLEPRRAPTSPPGPFQTS